MHTLRSFVGSFIRLWPLTRLSIVRFLDCVCVRVCVPDPVIDEICKRALLKFILASKVLLGICQGYSIRIDWLLIDGAWRKLFPYTGQLLPVECRGKRPCTRVDFLFYFYFLMDWRSRTDTGAGPSDESNLVETANVFLFSIPCYAMRIICMCVLYPGHTNNNRHNKWFNMSCVLYGIIRVSYSLFFLFLCLACLGFTCCRTIIIPQRWLVCLLSQIHTQNPFGVLLFFSCVCVDGTFFCILKSCL